MSEEEETFKVLDYKQFFAKYNMTSDNSRFINKAFSETGKSVALFANVLDKDVYLQLPDFGKDVVPSIRRYIYFLPAGEYLNIPHKVGEFGSGDKKISISMDYLKVWADPYTNLKEELVAKTKEEELIERMRELIEEYDRNR